MKKIVFISIFVFSSLSFAKPCAENLKSLISKAPSNEFKLLTDAQIVFPDQNKTIPGHILIQKDTIAKVLLNCDLSQIPKDLNTISLSNQWVIPGLQDLHIHNQGYQMPPDGLYDDPSLASSQFDFPGSEAILRRTLYAGVTSVLDLHSADEETFPLREKIQTNQALGSQFYSSGRLFTVTGGHAAKLGPLEANIVDSPKSAKSAVKQHVQKWNPDVIKVVYDHNEHRPASANKIERMPKDVMVALVKAAKAEQKKVVVHVGTWQDVIDSVSAGADAITHIPYGEIPPGALELLLEKKTFLITTMVAYMQYGYWAENEDLLQSLLYDPLTVAITKKANLNGLFHKEQYNPELLEWWNWSIEHNKIGYRKKSFQRLLDAGIPIISGSDSVFEGIFFGDALHRELAFMVEFGATPYQALATSTSHANDFLQHKRGQIKEGYFADLVVLSKNPISDIKNTREISTVFMNGEEVQRKLLDLGN